MNEITNQEYQTAKAIVEEYEAQGLEYQRLKLEFHLFTGKVATEIGIEKTTEILKEAKDAINNAYPKSPKSKFQERLDEMQKQREENQTT